MTLGLLYALACTLKLEAQHSNDVAEQSIFSNFFADGRSNQIKVDRRKLPL